MDLNIHERKVLFIIEMDKYRFNRPKEVINRFINYWTEFEKDNTFMRFELMSRFSIKHRLSVFERDNAIN